jgi:hypothetical protein
LSLSAYLDTVEKVMKISSTAVITNHFSPEAIPLKFINNFIKYCPALVTQLPRYFLLLITNDKISGFGCEENDNRYLHLCVQQISQGSQTEECGREAINGAVAKFKANVEGFSALL